MAAVREVNYHAVSPARTRRPELVELVADSMDALMDAVDTQILHATMDEPTAKTDRKALRIRLGLYGEENRDRRANVTGAGLLATWNIHSAAEARGKMRLYAAVQPRGFNCLFVLLDLVSLPNYVRIRYELVHNVIPDDLSAQRAASGQRGAMPDFEPYVGTVEEMRQEALYRLLNGKCRAKAPERKLPPCPEVEGVWERHALYSVTHGSEERLIPMAGVRHSLFEGLCYGYADMETRRPGPERDRMWRELPTLIRSDPFPLGYRGDAPETQLLDMLCRLKQVERPRRWFGGGGTQDFALDKAVAATFMRGVEGDGYHWASHIEAFLLQRMAILATVEDVYRDVVVDASTGKKSSGTWHIQLSIWSTHFGQPTDQPLSRRVTGILKAQHNEWALAVVHGMFYGVHRSARHYVREAAQALGVTLPESGDVIVLAPTGSDGTGTKPKRHAADPVGAPSSKRTSTAASRHEAVRLAREREALRKERRGHRAPTPESDRFQRAADVGEWEGAAAAAARRAPAPMEVEAQGASAAAGGAAPGPVVEQGAAAAAAAPGPVDQGAAAAAAPVPVPPGDERMQAERLGQLARVIDAAGPMPENIEAELGSAVREQLRGGPEVAYQPFDPKQTNALLLPGDQLSQYGQSVRVSDRPLSDRPSELKSSQPSWASGQSREQQQQRVAPTLARAASPSLSASSRGSGGSRLPPAAIPGALMFGARPPSRAEAPAAARPPSRAEAPAAVHAVSVARSVAHSVRTSDDEAGPPMVRSAMGAQREPSPKQKLQFALDAEAAKLRRFEGQLGTVQAVLARPNMSEVQRAEFEQRKADWSSRIAQQRLRREAAQKALDQWVETHEAPNQPPGGADAGRGNADTEEEEEEEEKESPEEVARRAAEVAAAERLRQQEQAAALEERRKKDEEARAAAAAAAALAEEEQKRRDAEAARVAEEERKQQHDAANLLLDMGDRAQSPVLEGQALEVEGPMFDIMDNEQGDGAAAAEEKGLDGEMEVEAVEEAEAEVQEIDNDGFAVPRKKLRNSVTNVARWRTDRIAFTPSRRKRMQPVLDAPRWKRGDPLPPDDVNMGCVFRCALDDFPELVAKFMRGLRLDGGRRELFLERIRGCRAGHASGGAWTRGEFDGNLTEGDLRLMDCMAQLVGLYVWADIDDATGTVRGTMIGPARPVVSQADADYGSVRQGNDLVPALRVRFLVAQMQPGPHDLHALDQAIGIVYNTPLGSNLSEETERIEWTGGFGSIWRDKHTQRLRELVPEEPESDRPLPDSAQSEYAVPDTLSTEQYEPARRWTFPGSLDRPDFWQRVFGHVAVAPLLDATELAMCKRMAELFAFLTGVFNRKDEGSSRLLIHRMIEAQCADWFNAVVRVVEFSYVKGVRLELFHRALRSARPVDVAHENDRPHLVANPNEDVNYRVWCNMLTTYVCCNVRGYCVTPYDTIGYANAHRELLLRPNGIRVAVDALPVLLEIVLPGIYATCHVAPPANPKDLATRVADGDAEALVTGKELAEALTRWVEEEDARKRGAWFARYLRKESYAWLGTTNHNWLVWRPAKVVGGRAYVDVGCVSFMPMPKGRLSLLLTPVDRRGTPGAHDIQSAVYTRGDRYIANPFVTAPPDPVPQSVYPAPMRANDADLVSWHAEEKAGLKQVVADTEEERGKQDLERKRANARRRKQESRARQKAGQPVQPRQKKNLPPVPIFPPRDEEEDA